MFCSPSLLFTLTLHTLTLRLPSWTASPVSVFRTSVTLGFVSSSSSAQREQSGHSPDTRHHGAASHREHAGSPTRLLATVYCLLLRASGKQFMVLSRQ